MILEKSILFALELISRLGYDSDEEEFRETVDEFLDDLGVLR